MGHKISFKNAWNGLVYVCRTQPNMRVHFIVATLVIIAGWYFSLARLEWLILLFTISLVMVAEMVNTAIESMTDLITTEHRQQAKVAKDVSAGMVLLTAMLSVIVGVYIFAPYLLGI